MKALVLSGGGLFGAWQAGAWSVLSEQFEPDLVVGASVGSLNGYAIACGASCEELCGMWREREFRDFGRLHQNLQLLTSRYSLRRPFALTVTDIWPLRVRVYRDKEITWRHLAASCALPLVLPQVRLNGRWSTDGGLLEALPISTAVALGATEIVGLHVLRPFPSMVLGSLAMAVRRGLGPSDTLPTGVRLRVGSPREKLGGLRDTAWASGEQVEAWIARGAEDMRAWAVQKPFPL